MLVFLTISTILFLATTIFLGKEFLRKFKCNKLFFENSDQLINWKYEGNRKPGMYNLVLRGQKPFKTLIGFKFNVPLLKYSGLDFYEFANSESKNVIVVSTYLGKNTCDFQFAISATEDNSMTITSTEEDQRLKPDSVYKPHWWQRLGIYG